MLTSPATVTTSAHHDRDRHDVEIVNRRAAVVGLAVFAGILGVLACVLATAGAGVLAAVTAAEAVLRLAEALGVRAGSRTMRRVAQGHCVVGMILAGLSMPLGVIGVAGNGLIFRALREE